MTFKAHNQRRIVKMREQCVLFSVFIHGKTTKKTPDKTIDYTLTPIKTTDYNFFIFYFYLFL